MYNKKHTLSCYTWYELNTNIYYSNFIEVSKTFARSIFRIGVSWKLDAKVGLFQCRQGEKLF